jgi:hypothetical protein
MHQNVSAPAEELQWLTVQFTDRQVGRLRYVGSNPVTAPVIEQSYRRFLELFETLLARRGFLFGNRPAAADFALFGQLTALAHFDPTPAALALRHAPRVVAWVDVVDDLSGLPDDADWAPAGTLGTVLRGLLTEIGLVYAPLLLANAASIAASQSEVTAEIGGQAWRQAPFPYHVKCLQELRRRHGALQPAARAQVDEWLAGTGAECLFAAA